MQVLECEVGGRRKSGAKRERERERKRERERERERKRDEPGVSWQTACRLSLHLFHLPSLFIQVGR